MLIIFHHGVQFSVVLLQYAVVIFTLSISCLHFRHSDIEDFSDNPLERIYISCHTIVVALKSDERFLNYYTYRNSPLDISPTELLHCLSYSLSGHQNETKWSKTARYTKPNICRP